MAKPLNYAVQYSQALAQAFPFSLYFGALYNTPNNNRYRIINAKTIEIPRLTTTGRTAADRDTIGTAARNYENSWETKTLNNPRKWSTLLHPADIDQTNMVATIANITQVYNEEQKFPEMDAYCVSKIYTDWTTTISEEEYTAKEADKTELSTTNVLSVFDSLMLKMDNARVPNNGRILYCTFEVKDMIKNATAISRSFNVQSTEDSINRTVSRLDEVTVVGVPSTLMKTKYNFTTGFTAAEDAKQINMFLVHPLSVITPVFYTFSQLDPPSALSEGKWYYYEESFEDVFILNKKADGIQFNITEGE